MAKAALVVVLPTPPLPEVTTIILANSISLHLKLLINYNVSNDTSKKYFLMANYTNNILFTAAQFLKHHFPNTLVPVYCAAALVILH